MAAVVGEGTCVEYVAVSVVFMSTGCLANGSRADWHDGFLSGWLMNVLAAGMANMPRCFSLLLERDETTTCDTSTMDCTSKELLQEEN